jgi:hypothetical protein
LLDLCRLELNGIRAKAASLVLFEIKEDLGVALGAPGSPKLSVTGPAEETGDATAAESEGKYPTVFGASANEAAKVLGLPEVRLMAASPRLVVEKAHSPLSMPTANRCCVRLGINSPIEPRCCQ